MGGEPVAVSAVIVEALGKSEERALILGWAYYLYAFNSYPPALGYRVFTVGTKKGFHLDSPILKIAY